MIRLAVADDHWSVSEGVRQIMANTPDIEVCGVAGDGAALQRMLLNSSFDVILLDLSMPGSVGYELIARLVKEYATTPIVVFTLNNQSAIATRAMQAGATGFVTKSSPPEVLIEAVRKASVGEKHVDPAVVNALIYDGVDQNNNDPQQLLTSRELQVLKMIVKGMHLGDIADALYVSPKTISTHKVNLMHKLGTKNNADLIRYAVEHGLGGD
ncbi:MAG: response regulator transcription factor [Betaproteobacteria bacterium]|nr:response regulator transcription factor [Betaproteobacteria bacterium]